MDSFEISLDHKKNIVRIKVIGEMNQAEGEKVITAARKTAGQNGYDILYDLRLATTNVAFANWFHLPRKLDVFNDTNARLIKAAIIASKQDKAIDDYKFYEVVTDNLGFKIRLFFDEVEAVSWLLRDRIVTNPKTETP